MKERGGLRHCFGPSPLDTTAPPLSVVYFFHNTNIVFPVAFICLILTSSFCFHTVIFLRTVALNYKFLS